MKEEVELEGEAEGVGRADEEEAERRRRGRRLRRVVVVILGGRECIGVDEDLKEGLEGDLRREGDGGSGKEKRKGRKG